MKCSPFPFVLYACLSQEEWDDVKDEVSAKYDDWISDGAAALHRGMGGASIVCVNPNDEDVDEGTLIGYIVHECVHAFQQLCSHINEDKPSTEFQSYQIQAMVEFVHKVVVDRNDLENDEEVGRGTQ